MTPVLVGRWQTRLFLMTVFGIPVTAFFAGIYRDAVTPFALLGYVILFGSAWDMLYHWLQCSRWERDWPPVLFAVSALYEGVVLWLLIHSEALWRLVGLETMPGVSPDLTLIRFAAHYLTVWFITFAFMLGPMKVLFPRWRFNGARLI